MIINGMRNSPTLIAPDHRLLVRTGRPGAPSVQPHALRGHWNVAPIDVQDGGL